MFGGLARYDIVENFDYVNDGRPSPAVASVRESA